MKTKSPAETIQAANEGRLYVAVTAADVAKHGSIEAANAANIAAAVKQCEAEIIAEKTAEKIAATADPFQKFLYAWKSILDAYKTRMGFTYFDEFGFEVIEGKKYIKICAVEFTDKKRTGQLCVSAFVNKQTGDIFKPAGWNAPAKHARGNINSPQHGMEAITPVGHVRYL